MNSHAIVIADKAGTIKMWSLGAAMLFGYSAQDAIGHSLDLIVPEEYRSRHWAGFHAAMTHGKSRLDGAAANIPVLCQDGQVRRFPARFVFLRDALGQATGAMAIYSPRNDYPANQAPLPDLG